MKKNCSVKTGGVLFLVLIFTIAAIELFSLPGCCCTPTEKAPKTAKQPLEKPAAIINAWQLIDNTEGEPITLTVTSSGTIYGFGGVNNYNGRLKASFPNGEFEFDGAMAATMKYAHGIQRESKFFQLLNKADSWQVNNAGQLELYSHGKIVAKFLKLAVTSNE